MNLTDRIEKHLVLHATPARVWRALTSAEEFGTWFRVKLESEFAVGAHVAGYVTYPGYEHLRFEVRVERMDAETLFSFHWHPYAIDPAVDYAAEPMTLVSFQLTPVPEGTSLTVVESGFDRLPPERRDEAFRMNDGGWAQQMTNIQGHVAG